MTLSHDSDCILAVHNGRQTAVCQCEPHRAERVWLDGGYRPAFARAAAYGALADREAAVRVACELRLVITTE